MSKRSWIILSIAAGTIAGLAGTTAGVAAYVHRARRAAAETAREAFDPYYGLMQYLLSVDSRERGVDGA